MIDYPHLKHGSFSFPPYLREASKYMGQERSFRNQETRSNHQSYDAGSLQKNLNIDVAGVYGELLAQTYFFSEGIKYKADKIVLPQSKRGADLVLDEILPKPKENGEGFEHSMVFNEIRIDVKMMRTTTPDFNVAKENHDKETNIRIYMFMRIAQHSDSIATFFIVDYDIVKNWTVKKSDQNYYYSCPVKELFPDMVQEALEFGK